MANLKMLPCPFCGGQPSMKHDKIGEHDEARIKCLALHCPVHTEVGGETEEEATALWNTRNAEGPARKAIKHVLERIREHPQVGYYCGELTETFDLLTEAAAVLFGENVDKIRDAFKPACPRKEP